MNLEDGRDGEEFLVIEADRVLSLALATRCQRSSRPEKRNRREVVQWDRIMWPLGSSYIVARTAVAKPFF